MRCAALLCAALPAAALLPCALAAQETPRLIARYGDPDVLLYQVRAADTNGADVALASESDPAIQLVPAGPDGAPGAPGAVRGFGREGEGPEELASPADVSWSEAGIVVLDLGNRKLVTFTDDGDAAAVRGLGDLWANRLFVAEGDTVLGAFVPMSRERAVLRVRGEVRDTLFRFEARGEETRLVAPNAPGFTVRAPFSPQPAWTILGDRSLVVWEPALGALRILDSRGEERSRVDVALEPLPVTEADREAWMQDTFETEFLGQHPFRPLRAVAERELTFPDVFPRVLELLPDPEGGVWVRRNTAGAGAVWTLVDLTGSVERDIRLPPGRELLAVGASAFVAHSLDALGIDQIELYER